MKKLLAIFLAALMLFAFAACDKDTADVSSDSPDTFTKPEGYASVVLITINPQFRLYLDASGKVLDIEPVNDDAKSIADEIEKTSGDMDAVINEIVSASNDGGFVKTATVTVDVTITEVLVAEVDADSLLEAVKTSAEDSFKDIQVSAKVETSIAKDAFSTLDTSSEDASSEDVSSEDASSEPQHTHSFAPATCKVPATCSCGETQGTTASHKYSGGKCSVCGAEDPNVTYTSIASKSGKWRAMYLVDGTLYDVTFSLSGELGFGVYFGDNLSSFPDDIDWTGMEDSMVTFDGQTYYCGRGSGDSLDAVKEDGKTVTIKDNMGAIITLSRTGENTMTVVSSGDFCELGRVPAGTVFTYKAN